ncbi:MAG TPA: hypothetical protein VKW06_19250 [Candidatus Angelobacter sp.]|nr:hypothetical protein [Candidatus Angelobacter sp.]
MKQTAAVRKMHPRTDRFTAPAAKAVHIISDKGGVDHDSVTIRLSAQEEVTWFAHGNQTATITFEHSPFHDSIFTVPAGGSVSTGAAKGASPYQRFKYTVTGPGGKNDPEVVIDR